MQDAGRVYKVGNSLIEVPRKVFEKIGEWNQIPKRNDVTFDKRVCHSLLYSLVSNENLRSRIISDDVMEFIKGIYFFYY